jgi:PAS domain S-box-containing protein
MSNEPALDPAADPLGDDERRQLVSAERDARAAAETALAALAKIEARYRSFVETTTEWVWACDVDGRHTYSNPAVLSILGYRPDEVVGGEAFELMHPDDRQSVLSGFRACIQRKEGWTGLLIRWRHRNGSYRYLESNGIPIVSPGGELEGFRGSDRDVTERVEAEEKLRAAEERYRNLIEELPLVTYIRPLDLSVANIYVSPQVEELLGYSAEDWVTDPGLLARIVHPDDRERVLSEAAHVRETGEPLQSDYRYLTPDGRVVWVRDETRLVRDADGNSLYVQGYLIDITDKRLAAEALQESEGRFRTLVSNIPGAIYRCACDADWTMEYISDEVAEITGYPPSDFVDKVRSFASIIHVEDRDDVARTVYDSVGEGRPYVLEYRVVTAAGKVRWVYEKGQAVLGPAGEPLWLDGAIFDVTERKEIERNLAAQNERLLEAEKITHLGSWSWDVAANVVTWSDEMFRIWGLDPAKFGASYEAYLETVHPDDRAFVEAQVEEALATGGFDYECRILRGEDGRERVIRGRGKVSYDEAGAPTTMIGTAQDITAQKEQEERLRQSDQLFRSIVESAPLGVNVCDLDGRVIETNQTLREMLGYSAEELHGMSWVELTHPDDLARDLELFRELVEGKRDYYQIEKRDLRKDGSPLWVRLTVSAVRNDHNELEFTLAMVEDITQRKEIDSERERLLEQERANNARLRELDRLKDTFVASVSHELRTPLTSISGFLQLIQDGLAGETTEEQRRCLAIAGRNADRLHRLIGDLLFVAQMDAGQFALEPTQVDLRTLAAECLESIRPRAMQAGVEVVLEGDAVAGFQGDPSRLTQLLDNLVSNAIKFSSKGGQVAVRTTAENGNVVLEVADQGIGIPAEQQRHLFQRFFRGSNASESAIQGTGIGLSIVKAIVDAHGGSIAVESREGAGTIFRIAFPLRMPPVVRPPKRIEAA